MKIVKNSHEVVLLRALYEERNNLDTGLNVNIPEQKRWENMVIKSQ